MNDLNSGIKTKIKKHIEDGGRVAVLYGQCLLCDIAVQTPWGAGVFVTWGPDSEYSSYPAFVYFLCRGCIDRTEYAPNEVQEESLFRLVALYDQDPDQFELHPPNSVGRIS